MKYRIVKYKELGNEFYTVQKKDKSGLNEWEILEIFSSKKQAEDYIDELKDGTIFE